MLFTSRSGRIKLEMTLEQAQSVSHQGRCDEDLERLRRAPAIARQLAGIGLDALRDELLGYHVWGPDELEDHDTNLIRILWLAAEDIVDKHKA
jgi:hypothetical protein